MQLGRVLDQHPGSVLEVTYLLDEVSDGSGPCFSETGKPTPAPVGMSVGTFVIAISSPRLAVG